MDQSRKAASFVRKGPLLALWCPQYWANPESRRGVSRSPGSPGPPAGFGAEAATLAGEGEHGPSMRWGLAVGSV